LRRRNLSFGCGLYSEIAQRNILAAESTEKDREKENLAANKHENARTENNFSLLILF